MKKKGYNNKSKKRTEAIFLNYRSGLEKDVADILKLNSIKFKFEPKESVIEWSVKSRKRSLKCSVCGCKDITETHNYTTDFVLEDGKVLLESKGRFMSSDRIKMEAVHKQNPDKLIIMLYSNPRNRIIKKSKTRYLDWCDKRGIKWLDFRNNEWVHEMNKIIVSWKKEQKIKKQSKLKL